MYILFLSFGLLSRRARISGLLFCSDASSRLCTLQLVLLSFALELRLPAPACSSESKRMQSVRVSPMSTLLQPAMPTLLQPAQQFGSLQRCLGRGEAQRACSLLFSRGLLLPRTG